MNTRRWICGLALGCMVVTGCAEGIDEDGPTPEEVESTGLALSVDFQGDTDVTGFDYEVRRCGHHKMAANGSVALEDLVLPGMIPDFEKEPFDPMSRHLFSDYFTMLEAGCYDVKVHPVTKKGVLSEQCGTASANGVEVAHGHTTEILLISQCEGPERGALDVIAALNNPPRINSVQFSKFNQACDQVKVCATATDPDQDPMRFSWKQTAGPKLASPIQVVGAKEPKPCKKWYCKYLKNNEGNQANDLHHGGQATECITMRLGKAGAYEFKLKVQDLYWAGDKMRPFDDSKATLSFPVYAGEADGYSYCKPKKGYYGDGGHL